MFLKSKFSEKMMGKIRIIGGKWRSRKIIFPDIPGLRPTSDRIRETLFNWLAPYVCNSHYLDLFAGSGALGFEALSRGASQVTFVDQSWQVIDILKKNAGVFEATCVKFICSYFTKAIFSLKNTPFDIVFLDPPFRKNLVGKAALELEKNKLLAKEAFIYVEMEKNFTPLSLPESWRVYRKKVTSHSSYYLFISS